MKKSAGQITNILGTAVKEVFNWCAEKDKRLIVEDIDLTIKLASRKYGNRKGNHHMTLFDYQRITSSIENQSFHKKPTRISGQELPIHSQAFQNISSIEEFRMKC